MRNKLQTLVILSPGFPKDEADTACIPPQQLFVKALKETYPNLNIIVLTFHYPFIGKEYLWNDVKVIALGGKGEGRVLRIKTWIKAWFILIKLNRKHSLIGLLSFWFGECAFIGTYFARHYNLLHYSWLLGQDAKTRNKYFKWIKPKKENLIALSDFIAREVKNNYGIGPLQVFPLGIDTSLFSDLPVKRDIDILGAGSLIPLKQYSLFVEAVRILKQSFPQIKTVICGKGPEMEKLKVMTAGLNLKDNILFTGELPHNEVLALMQRAKVFLHPSAYEGFGSVLAEALYAGAHVVSFCKPMDKDHRHHHIVKSPEEMNIKVLAILKNTDRGHDRILMCPVQQIAKNMISLFVQ